jgi:hypothetical protein
MPVEYDAIVVGSGLVGGWATKALVDCGLNRTTQARGTPGGIHRRFGAALRGQWIQSLAKVHMTRVVAKAREMQGEPTG